MRKNILILVGAVVLFSLFNTASTNFIFWNIPSVDNTNINSPEIPVSFNTEPSVFGLIINFFTQLDCSIDKASNYEVVNIISDFSTQDDLALEVITGESGIEEVILKNVQFDNNSYVLNSSSINELDRFINYLSKDASLKISIDGHTDNIGSVERNKVLSKNRAKSVYEYLASNGVNKDQLVSYNGYGESNPISTNDTQDGRALNRRTSFRLINNISDELENQEIEAVKEPAVVDKQTQKPALANNKVKEPTVIDKQTQTPVVVNEKVKKPVIQEKVKEPVIEEKVKEPVIEEKVTRRKVNVPVINEDPKEESLPSDEDIIRQNPNIKENAKELILDSLEDGILTINDVDELLKKYVNRVIKKKDVKKLIKKKRK